MAVSQRSIQKSENSRGKESSMYLPVAGSFRKVTKLVSVPWERQDPDSEYKPRRPRPTPHMAEFIDTS